MTLNPKRVTRLETMDQYDKAAALALFSGLRERAIEALGSTRGSGKDGKGTDSKDWRYAYGLIEW